MYPYIEKFQPSLKLLNHLKANRLTQLSHQYLAMENSVYQYIYTKVYSNLGKCFSTRIFLNPNVEVGMREFQMLSQQIDSVIS